MRRPARRLTILCVAGVFLLVFLPAFLAFAAETRWIPLSRVMMELSQNPEFVDALLKRLGRDPRAGGILGSEQIKRLREIL